MFSSFVDCAPWVIGGLWHGELATLTAENATLANHLRADLQRITRSANDALKLIKRAGLADSARQAHEARIIDEARAKAVRRVESTIRHVRAMKAEMLAGPRRAQVTERFAGTDIDETQVIPAIAGVEPAAAAPTDTAPEPQEPTDADRHEAPVAPPLAAAPSAPDHDELGDSVARHWAPDDAATAVITPEPEMPQALEAPGSRRAQDLGGSGNRGAFGGGGPKGRGGTGGRGGDGKPGGPRDRRDPSRSRIRERTIAAATRVRCPPRTTAELGGQRSRGRHDGTGHRPRSWLDTFGYHASGGRAVIGAGRRAGKVFALVGEATQMATYTPGDFIGRGADFAATESSVQPRELPAVDDLGWELGRATHWRDGLPRLVHTLAKAAAAGTGVVEEEVDLLRVHLDTARYQLLIQYPDVGPALLLNCLLLAATESVVTGHSISANYHLAWFQKLDEPPASQRTAER